MLLYSMEGISLIVEILISFSFGSSEEMLI